jgi:predicted RNase H-like HicB family nuclease
MKNEFTAIIERDGDWYIAYCPEIPGANGQGRTKDEARENLAEAIELILEDRREDALRGVPPDAIRETVTVKRSGAHCSSTYGGMVAISKEKEVLIRYG